MNIENSLLQEKVNSGIKYFEENNIEASEKTFSMLMANDVSWKDLEKIKIRAKISNELKKLI